MPSYAFENLLLDIKKEYIFNTQRKVEIEKKVVDKVLSPQDAKLIKSSLHVELGIESTYLVVIAVDSNADNSMIKIPCHHGKAIGGYVYDHVNDCYRVNCVDYAVLGYIPVSYKISSSCGLWSNHVPTPEIIIRRHLSEEQKKIYTNFKTIHQKEKISFIQTVD